MNSPMTTPPKHAALARRTTSWVGRLAIGVTIAVATSCGSGADESSVPDAQTAGSSAPDTSGADATTAVSSPSDSLPSVAPATTVADAATTPETSPATEPGEAADAGSAGPSVIEHAYGTTEVPADPQRIVALSEEFLLADLLALGVTPVASSSNEAESFGGIDPALTEGIEITTSATFNLEQLAAFRPDLILAYPVYIELVGYDQLSQIAPTVAIGTDDSDWRERLELTAEVLGVESLGAEKVQEYQAVHDAASETLDGVRISAASIFDAAFIRAYTDGGTFLAQVMVDAGVELVPGSDSVAGVDEVGRIELSAELVDLLAGDVLVLLQRPGIEDEAAAEVLASPLWASLPAVQSNAIVTLDRLGYPGAAGAAAFAADLAVAVAALG